MGVALFLGIVKVNAKRRRKKQAEEAARQGESYVPKAPSAAESALVAVEACTSCLLRYLYGCLVGPGNTRKGKKYKTYPA